MENAGSVAHTHSTTSHIICLGTLGGGQKGNKMKTT